jgi:hypothetical protein
VLRQGGSVGFRIAQGGRRRSRHRSHRRAAGRTPCRLTGPSNRWASRDAYEVGEEQEPREVREEQEPREAGRVRCGRRPAGGARVCVCGRRLEHETAVCVGESIERRWRGWGGQ